MPAAAMTVRPLCPRLTQYRDLRAGTQLLVCPQGCPSPPHVVSTALAPSAASPAPYLAAGYTVSCSGATSFPSTLT